MPPSSPGPSRTASGRPWASAVCPGASPPVYSYAWTVTTSPPMATTSPGSPAGPIETRSYIAMPPVYSISTSGPVTRRIRETGSRSVAR